MLKRQPPLVGEWLCSPKALTAMLALPLESNHETPENPFQIIALLPLSHSVIAKD